MAKNPHITSKKLLWSGLGFLVVALAVAGLEFTNTTHFFHKSVSTISASQPKSTTASTTNTTDGTSDNSTTSSSTGTKSVAPADSPAANSGTPPVKPSGNFISNHRPNLSGSPAPSQERSVCVTTPGASCSIELSMGNVIKRLDAQTTDSNGAAYWTWDVATDGLTTGNWQITAVATQNGSSVRLQDPQPLEVQP